MSDYINMTAAELAAELDQILNVPAKGAPTGWVSMLDEATLAYRATMPGTQVAEMQHEFGNARSAFMRSYTTERGDYDAFKWNKVQYAAANLACALRRLGEHRIARCTEEAGWGVCNLPLNEDGSCGSRFHVNKEA